MRPSSTRDPTTLVFTWPGGCSTHRPFSSLQASTSTITTPQNNTILCAFIWLYSTLITSGLKWAPLDEALGNPSNPSYIPTEYVLSFGQHMSFKQRLLNTLTRYFFRSYTAKISSNHRVRKCHRYIVPSVDYQLRISMLEPEIKDMLNLTETPDLVILYHRPHTV